MKNKLYENIVIGNFLYSLGFAVRAKSLTGTVPSVINLLQQSPADELLGDVFLRFPGVVRLIEFKNEANRSNKEKTKNTILIKALEAEPELQEVSRKVHWYIETVPSKTQAFDVKILPYLDAFLTKEKNDKLEDYIEALAIEVAEHPPTVKDDEAMKYIRWLKNLQGKGEVGTGGLLLVADADGTLHFAELVDMMELRMKHRFWVELNHQKIQRELAYQHELVKEQERVKGKERTIEHDGMEP